MIDSFLQKSYLFRVATDPFESRDVAPDFPDIFRSHLDAERGWFSDTGDWEPEVDLHWELEMNERLEALDWNIAGPLPERALPYSATSFV